VTGPDRLALHVRSYGSHDTSALPVVCLPGLARTGADFHLLAAALAAEPAAPRRVVVLDYRGHGASDYDSNPERYGIRTDLADLLTVLTTLDIARAVFVGTSHGGVLAMMLARSRPTALAGVVLNDIGPVIEPRALLQIKGHLGRLPVPRDFADGAEILRKLFGARFPRLTSRDWIAFAERTWRDQGGSLAVDYDVRLARRLQFDPEFPAPTLWSEFDALSHLPLMVIRGAYSTMLVAGTLNAMLARRRELDIVVVPDQGHAPLLDTPRLVRRIAAFVGSCDVADRPRQSASEPTDRFPVGEKQQQDRPIPDGAASMNLQRMPDSRPFGRARITADAGFISHHVEGADEPNVRSAASAAVTRRGPSLRT
jgi:pimeloyl-ACP methyl ester carboxylesterase